ncbi:MAG TPA: PA2779 family protein [Burkholderiales bacterium]|nr:PA2779 family protein [Burkholderiales bacterium]
MTCNPRHVLSAVAFSVLLGVCAYAPPASAGLIGTNEAAPAQSERERVKALLARPEVAKKLESLGVMPKDAQARVDALTDEEVGKLAGRIDALPAGGMTDQNWLLVIIVILLLVIAL